MDLTSPKNIRKQYVEILADRQEYKSVLSEIIKKKDNEPILYYNNLNYEDVPDYKDEQRELLEISLDINSINSGLVEIKNKIVDLLNSVDDAIESISFDIKKENERISDINIICAQNSDFNMVIPIYSTDFNDSSFENIDNKYFGANLEEQEEIEYEIIDISGNGISGNSFVYNNEEFESEENDYSDKTYISDDNDISKFEYSRYLTTSKNEVIEGIINYDQKPVEMCISLSAETKFNKIAWLTENKNLTILKLETSDDGISFTQRLQKKLEVEKTNKIYNDSTYIYGSNILCFPYSYYVRITFSSDEITNDIIAIEDEDNDVINMYPNSTRKKIAINNIKLYKSRYSSTILESDNIIVGGSVDKAGLFASEYIPEHFTGAQYIQYFLIVNGTEYEVSPVNSGGPLTKIIKFSKESSSENNDYVFTINETIKSVKIKIVINSNGDNETPYVGNLKLCLGKETESMYV